MIETHPGFVNDNGDKCTDCNIADPPFPVGSIVWVKAWWRNGTPTKCEVVAAAIVNALMDVKPCEGNPHFRSITIKDVVVEKPNYRNEFNESEAK